VEHWIDHLVLAVASLDEGIAHVADLTGVAPVPGGSHPGGGTHNALASLGAPTYLEVIAPDPAQPDVAHRSFGLADPPAAPRLVAFAVGCSDIDATVARLRAAGHDGVGDPFAMTRQRPDGTVLAWRLASVAERIGGAHPFLISWDGGASPAGDSPVAGRLETLRGGDPDPTARAALLATLGIDVAVEASGTEWLTATIETPAGAVVSLG
jgi:hypothetical protein